MSKMDDIYEATRKIAEGQIRCTCGNDDWTAFIYVTGGMAGCKKCGSVYQYNGTWELKTKGPGLK